MREFARGRQAEAERIEDNIKAAATVAIVFILDFYHASEHLLEFAKVLHRDDEARQQQTQAGCHKLKHEGGQSLLRELEARDMTRASPQTGEVHRQLLGYLRNNQHRMDYPTYISNGWQIGSGMVEAACKTVVCQRLKESGMRDARTRHHRPVPTPRPLQK